MAITIITSPTLQVVDKYAEILEEMFVDDSVYLRMKDTLAELLTSGDLSGPDKAKVISEVMAQLNNSLVNASLATALQWAEKEAELGFKKEELAYQLELLNQQGILTAANAAKTAEEKNLVTAQVGLTTANKLKTEEETKVVGKQIDQMANEALKTAAEIKKLKADTNAVNVQTAAVYGIATYNTSTEMVTAVAKTGTKVQAEIDLATQEKTNKVTEERVLQGRVQESIATVHKVYADTAANFGGTTTSTKDSNGWYTITYTPPTGTTASDTLSYYQKEIAKQQAKGYVYNAWSNAVNASATTLGLLISENDAATETQVSLQTSMLKGICNLIGATSSDTTAVPSTGCQPAVTG
jgi:hypothetical protein